MIKIDQNWSKLRLTHCLLITSKIIDNVEESKKVRSAKLCSVASLLLLLQTTARQTHSGSYWSANQKKMIQTWGMGMEISFQLAVRTLQYITWRGLNTLIFNRQRINHISLYTSHVSTNKKGYFITDTEIYEILRYVESNNLASIF